MICDPAMMRLLLGLPPWAAVITLCEGPEEMSLLTTDKGWDEEVEDERENGEKERELNTEIGL